MKSLSFRKIWRHWAALFLHTYSIWEGKFNLSLMIKTSNFISLIWGRRERSEKQNSRRVRNKTFDLLLLLSTVTVLHSDLVTISLGIWQNKATFSQNVHHCHSIKNTNALFFHCDSPSFVMHVSHSSWQNARWLIERWALSSFVGSRIPPTWDPSSTHLPM